MTCFLTRDGGDRRRRLVTSSPSSSRVGVGEDVTARTRLCRAGLSVKVADGDVNRGRHRRRRRR